MVTETLFSIVNSRYHPKGQVFPWFYQVRVVVLKAREYICISYLEFLVWSFQILFAL